MIAKIVAQAPSRGEALERLATARGTTVVVGPRVNTPLLKAIIEHPEFRAGRFDTGFIGRHRGELLAVDAAAAAQAVGSAVAVLLERERARIAGVGRARPSPLRDLWQDPWSANDGFMLGPPRTMPLDVMVDGAARQVYVAWGADGPRVTVDGVTTDARQAGRAILLADGVVMLHGGRQYHVALRRFEAADAGQGGGDGTVRAPMNGRIVAVQVEPGQRVARGTRVALMEAMKMEHSLAAPIDGTVAEVMVVAGVPVVAGAPIVRIEADDVKP